MPPPRIAADAVAATNMAPKRPLRVWLTAVSHQAHSAARRGAPELA
jgi:hypothetical protein